MNLYNNLGYSVWDDDVYFIERELLGDRVRRLVWQAYLQMAKLPFTNGIAPNADYMSPTGTTTPVHHLFSKYR